MSQPSPHARRAALAPRAPALASLVALVALCGCAVNPVTGRSEVLLMSVEEEARIGAEQSRVVAEQMGLVEDPELTGYVAGLGERIARHSPRRDVPYAFQVVDIEEPNAFALPGGYIYVSRGLLALTNSEAELANVLGHEIAHVAARHAAQRQTRAAGAGLLSLGGAILGAALGVPGQVLGAPLQVIGAGLIASYSRDQEREADRIGQELVARAGVDPGGMPAFLDTLERATRLRGPGRHPSFFDSHPATPERLEATRRDAAALGGAAESDGGAARAAHLRRIEGLLIGPDPGQGVVRDGLFLHADLDFALRFPDGWVVVNARDALGGFSPRRDARLVLEVQGRGDDPAQAADVFFDALAQRVPVRVIDRRSGSVGGSAGPLPAHRALAVVQGPGGRVPLHMTWIANGGVVYRLTGAGERGLTSANLRVFDAIAASFRPLGAEERASIRETRLRLATARPGESLAGLSARTENVWDLATTAVYNAVDESFVPTPGAPLKVARRYPYRPRR